ncbi:MAG: transcriptional regulator NrdR [Lachnospiraceae bacterium]|jgi:transcriptional repressor NrdR|nr:transcriptional regulator NrdR [Lachnospiraceae bacterium]MCH4030343.1 transcriptional regulator NrdR [Lachnospiraceae bacterium]MCH4069555.1 transcriptional regulator NrdR [Lachnospiraceae bacterium]MCH4107509.1 transcriptional regulator NrdR [Lachnospiraceae bacterium]MCI1301640.1 transcriptional regulator NrdR [Lachnospiraceae bacterium]
MNCPYCGAEDTKVIDSRPSEDGSIRRRRQCIVCGRRFTTYERLETTPLIVIKKDKTREPFDRNKIYSGVVRSCYKTQVTQSEMTKLTDEVEAELLAMDKQEIPSSVIGDLVMKKLKALNEVAYVRFASVYREFKDVESFMDEVSSMKDKGDDT